MKILYICTHNRCRSVLCEAITNASSGPLQAQSAGSQPVGEVHPLSLHYLAEKGYNPQYGARPLKRLIQNEVLTPIATEMISGEMMSGGSVAIDYVNEKLTFVVKKKGTRKRKNQSSSKSKSNIRSKTTA